MPLRFSRVVGALLSLALCWGFVAFVVAPVGAANPVTATPRIVSLMPSLTEDLFAIGAGPQVVGVSQFTDRPAAAAKLPAVASFASVDAERIVRLHPGLVVGITAQAALVAGLRNAGLRIELLRDDSFDDLFATLTRLGVLSGHPREATQLAKSLRRRTAQLVARVPAGPRPRTFVVLGVAPIYTVGERSYIAHLIELAGGVDAARIPDAYARFGSEALVALQPDAIVADRTSGLANALVHAPWNALSAVRSGRVYILDDADILERPGPRYNEGLAWLIARLRTDAPHVAR
jgi:iron complex transport system substrate-binding protein